MKTILDGAVGGSPSQGTLCAPGFGTMRLQEREVAAAGRPACMHLLNLLATPIFPFLNRMGTDQAQIIIFHVRIFFYVS
jgi:hypothetical protein